MSSSTKHTFQFHSVEEAGETLSELGWETEYRQLTPGCYTSSLSALEGDDWFLLDERSEQMVENVGPAPQNMYVLGLLIGNEIAVNHQRLTEDHLWMQCPGSEFRATLPAGFRALQIGVSEDRMNSLVNFANPDFKDLVGGVRCLPVAPGSLRGVQAALRQALARPTGRASLMQETISNLIVSCMKAVTSNDSATTETCLHSSSAQTALQRALDIIEARLTRDIRIEELCKHAKMNQRTLERVFLSEFGLSPQKYVKARRLSAVRRSLLVANYDQGTSVTDVALQHGFSHLGRFAGDYKAQFGEYPRDTLAHS